MRTCLRALVVGLLMLSAGCADFDKAKEGYCERNPGNCGELPVTIDFATAAQQVQVGSCSSVVTVRFLGPDGSQKTVKTDSSLALTATPSEGFQFFTNEGCTGAPVTAVPVPASASTASFFFKGTRVGAATLNVATGSLSANQAVTLTPTPPTAVALVLPANPVAAGTCTSGQVQVKDQSGAITLATAATTVNLEEVPSTSVAFYSDAACTTPARSVTIAANQGEATFYFLGQATGKVTVNASATELTPASQSVEITPGTSNRLIFVTAPLVVVAGTCSAVVSIQSRDPQGTDPVPAPSQTTIRLAASPAAGLRFYSDSSCATEVSTLPLSATTTNASFYFKGVKAGNATVTVTATSYSGSSQAETINPGPPAAIALSGPTQVPAGDCASSVTAELRDAQGNLTTAGADTVINLSASGVPLTFFSGAGCSTASSRSITISKGASSATFSFRGVQAGDTSVSGASTGLTTGTLAVKIAPSPTSVLTITSNAQTVPAGSCSQAVTVQAGPAGSPATVDAAVAVSLGAPPTAGVTFFSNSTCGTVVTQVSIPAGQSTTNFWFKSTTLGTATLTVSATGLTSATQSETITAGAPSQLRFTTPPRTSTAGTCSPIVTLQSVDAYGNVSPVSANVQVSFSPQFRSTYDAQFGFYSDASCTTPVPSVTLKSGESSVSVFYRGVKAQSVGLQVFASPLTGASQDHTILGATATTLAFSPSTPPQTLLAGTCALRTVQGRDAFDNPSANPMTLALSADSAAEFFKDAACTTPVTQVDIPSGLDSTSFYFKGVTGGINTTAPVTLRASSPGLTDATQTETVIPTVRTGSCSLSSVGTNCNIMPPLQDATRAFLVFQATTPGTTNYETHVRCYIDTSSSLKCERAQTGAPVDIRWSVAEFPSGVAVQSMSVSCQTTYVSLSSVSPDRSFLLLSGMSSGAAQDNRAMRSAELTSSFEVQLRRSGGCTSSDVSHLQVVDYTGASVQRGLGSVQSGASSTQVPLAAPVASDRSILLYSYLSGSNTSVCNRMLRGELSSDGMSLRFSRGAGSFNCTSQSIDPISWEVVQFPPGTLVQQVTLQFTGSSALVPLPKPVDLSRTFVIAGGQWASGQTSGEGQYLSSDGISDMRAQAWLVDNSTMQVTRATNFSTASFTVFVVQLKP